MRGAPVPGPALLGPVSTAPGMAKEHPKPRDKCSDSSRGAEPARESRTTGPDTHTPVHPGRVRQQQPVHGLAGHHQDYHVVLRLGDMHPAGQDAAVLEFEANCIVQQVQVQGLFDQLQRLPGGLPVSNETVSGNERESTSSWQLSTGKGVNSARARVGQGARPSHRCFCRNNSCTCTSPPADSQQSTAEGCNLRVSIEGKHPKPGAHLLAPA